MKVRLYIKQLSSEIYSVSLENTNNWIPRTGEEVYKLLLNNDYIPMWVDYKGNKTIKEHFNKYNPNYTCWCG